MMKKNLFTKLSLVLLLTASNISLNLIPYQSAQAIETANTASNLDAIPLASFSSQEVDSFLNIQASRLAATSAKFQAFFNFANLPIINKFIDKNNNVNKINYFNNNKYLTLNELPTNSNLFIDYYNANSNNIIIIDNDEEVDKATKITKTIEFKDLPTDETRTKIITGATFPVVFISEISSKSAKKGDPIEARLKYDLKIGDKLIAKKGATINGHINYVLKARSQMVSALSKARWGRTSGCLGVAFDDLININGEHVPLVATPARCALVINNKAEGRLLGINHNGQIAGPLSQQLKAQAIKIGINAALAPAGVFSFGAVPAILGVIGAANPSIIFAKPIGLNVRHRRLKGFAWGVLAGVPGSFLIEDTVIKGQEAIIKPGDELLAEFKQEFTGQPSSEADYTSGSGKVHGEVLPAKKRAVR